MSNANVIVLSGSLSIKTAIAEALKKEPDTAVHILCRDLDNAQLKFIRHRLNILILDVETNPVEYRYLKALTERHMLSVIVLGRRMPFADQTMPFVIKPLNMSPESLGSMTSIICQKVKSLSNNTPVFRVRDLSQQVDARQKIIAMTASTGGTEALPVLLSALPKEMPPILIVQHMPAIFTRQLADRIDKMCQIHVKEAAGGELLLRGTAYIAPGDMHMKLAVRQQKLAVDCFRGDKINGVRPAADVLFESVAHISGANAVGVILTGMGSDGAKGLIEMKKKGSKIIGQNKETCVVYGMPKAAFDLGAVDFQLPLERIAGKMQELVR